MSFGYSEEVKPEKLIKGMTKKEYHRHYMKLWARKTKDFNIKPSAASKFKVYYSEYITMKQQDGEPIPTFTEFFQQFFEIGYMSWRSKMKGK